LEACAACAVETGAASTVLEACGARSILKLVQEASRASSVLETGRACAILEVIEETCGASTILEVVLETGAASTVLEACGARSILKIVLEASRASAILSREHASDAIGHLSAYSDLGKCEADRVTEFIKVLVVPLSRSVAHLVVHILSVDDQIAVAVEDEVPRLCQRVRHLAHGVQTGAQASLALSQLVNDVMDDVT